MSKKSPVSNGSNGEKVAWKGFVTINLPYNLKFDDIHGAFDVDGFEDLISDLIRAGYKVTFTYHKESDSVVCAVTGVDSQRHNAGYTLSTFGANVVRALAGTFYKVAVIANWESWATVGSQGRREL